MLRIETKKKWTIACIKGESLSLQWQAYLTSIYFVGNLKKALAQRRDGLWHMRIIKLSSCGMLKEIGIFLGQNWYIKLHQCSVIGNIYSQRILGNLEFLHKKSLHMYEIEERKSHIFSIKFQMYNLYIHNLSAMKLTNCVEIKLSAPPTAKCDLQLLFK